MVSRLGKIKLKLRLRYLATWKRDDKEQITIMKRRQKRLTNEISQIKKKLKRVM